MFDTGRTVYECETRDQKFVFAHLELFRVIVPLVKTKLSSVNTDTYGGRGDLRKLYRLERYGLNAGQILNRASVVSHETGERKLYSLTRPSRLFCALHGHCLTCTNDFFRFVDTRIRLMKKRDRIEQLFFRRVYERRD